jgi:hypothetical protein
MTGNINIPNMGDIIMDPKVLMNTIFQGLWIVTKNDKAYLFDGTNTGKETEIELRLVTNLKYSEFISIDSGNWDFGETYYCFDSAAH